MTFAKALRQAQGPLLHERAVDGLVFIELATSSKKLEDELAYDSLTLFYISR